MSARDQAPAERVKSAQDLADDHDLRIIRARQRCQAVGFNGAKYFVSTHCHHDGDAEMVVYLKGRADPVRPCDITILEQPT